MTQEQGKAQHSRNVVVRIQALRHYLLGDQSYQ